MPDSFLNVIKKAVSSYRNDTIFILGKGPSSDQIPTEVFEKSVVIGLNDAERIYPADISIFHAEWMRSALSNAGARAKLYITSTDFSVPGAVSYRVPHLPLTQESSDLMVQRLLGKGIFVEDVLFMSALRVARAIAEIRGRTQTVYMVGFDFSADLVSANALGRTFQTDSEDQSHIRLDIQENFLLNAFYALKDSEIDVKHVGSRAYSALTTSQLSDHFLRPEKTLVSPWNVEIVAELTTNHFGDRARLEKLVRAAKAAGADYVKVQKRNVETFYSKEQLDAPYRSPFGTKFSDYRHQLELDRDDFAFLNDLCDQIGIRWFASVLDMPSYKFLLEFNPPLLKLPSTISEHKEYLSMVARNCDHPLVLSTGMTDKAFENWVLEKFSQCPKLYLLQCNSAYPTPMADCEIGVIRHYNSLSKTYPNIVPGYSSHDPGWFASALAVAAGARMIEKHVKIGNSEWAHFDAVAMDLGTSEFSDFVTKIREAETVVGSEEKTVRPSEHHKYVK
ncbi:MAG: N-acetylneuraminate synthase family protein [Rhodobacteraceae bacterium]|nr:N-acetylneuraminate synthase family protein [Paracoccaceae bacterium]